MEATWTSDAQGESVKDRGHLAELYQLHSDAALRLAYLITGDRALAEDLTHEAFIKVFGRFQDLRERSSFPAYLRTAIVNLAYSHFRRKRLERRLEKNERPPSSSSEARGIEERDELRSALLQLPVRQRAAIVLRYYEDLSERQTADAMGISPAAVKSLVARGMNDLRTNVTGEAEQDRPGGQA